MTLVLVDRNFDGGYQSDPPRDQLKTGTAYRMRDWIPEFGSALRKRGGWSLATADLNTIHTCSHAAGLAWLPFPDDPHLLILADNGKVYLDKTFDYLGGSFVGNTSFAPITHAPIWHNDLSGAVILQALGATAAPPYKYYDSGSLTYVVAPLGGTPPQACVGASWGDYLLLANGYVGGTRYENRIWISGVGDAETWNTGQAFWDMKAEVLSIVPLQTSIVVFGYADVWRLTGDTPPPGGNWSEIDLFHGNGCMDGRSVVTWQNYAIWANNTGIFKTDGISFEDLTEAGGIKQRWRDLVSSFNHSRGWSAAAGVYRNHYIITVYDDTGTFVTCQVCNLDRGIWFEFTNMAAAMFATRPSGPGTSLETGSEELFFAHRTLPYACKVSSCWSPDATVVADGDGSAVLPQLETPYYKLGSPSRKRIRLGRFTYDIRTAGANPYLGIEYALSPEAGSAYTSLDGVLPTTTTQTRAGVQIRQLTLGLGLRITQALPSADTRLSEIEFDQNILEGMR